MIINLISSPRNISTAVMYSFAQRSDTRVMDEPFYSYYLTISGARHPGRDEIIHSQPDNSEMVLKQINDMHNKYSVVFLKNMAHHLVQKNISFLDEFRNVFLIRDPAQLIASFAQVIKEPKMTDIGLERQYELFEILTRKNPCPVIDSNEVLKAPQKVLTELCGQLGIPFDKAMLSWSPGAIPEDGIWAKYWYQNVHASSGFSRKNIRTKPLPKNCKDLYSKALPLYEKLFEHSIKA